ANAVVALAGSCLFQVPAEIVGIPEGGQVGFALDFGFRVSRGVGGEHGAGPLEPAPVRRLAEHTKAESRRSCRRHGLFPPPVAPSPAGFLERFGFAAVPLVPAGGSPLVGGGAVPLASAGGLPSGGGSGAACSPSGRAGGAFAPKGKSASGSTVFAWSASP